MATLDHLKRLSEKLKKSQLSFSAKCHDCGQDTIVEVDITEDSADTNGGGYWNIEGEDFIKCQPCYDKDPTLRNFRKCEVYSRVVGYLRPVKQWNPGKQEEYKQRKNFKTG
jgi:anaerobic ribonucleoside-triphosphate reductase